MATRAPPDKPTRDELRRRDKGDDVPETQEISTEDVANILAGQQALATAAWAEEQVREQEQVEREYRESALGSRVLIVESLYPPLTLVENIENGINFEYHVAPTSYQESFKSRWMSEDQSHGYLNPIFSYGGTEREVAMSFVLPAMTVGQARNNLEQCSKLSRTVYGKYRHLSISDNTANNVRVFAGERKFTVDFGSLIRDEKAVIGNFAFTVNTDAGVFDYEEGGDTDVTHSTLGLLLPRQLSVDITFIFIHDYPLGFGGRRRIQGTGDLKWAENRNRDWPHGTGEIPVREYMSEDSVTYEDGVTPDEFDLLLNRTNGRVYEGLE